MTYEEVATSPAFPPGLTEFLARSQRNGQDETLLAFEEWLRAQQG